jgi:hypothetical protein
MKLNKRIPESDPAVLAAATNPSHWHHGGHHGR